VFKLEFRTKNEYKPPTNVASAMHDEKMLAIAKKALRVLVDTFEA
jgi:hypothetical protein